MRTSVVIPTFDRAVVLPRALDSVLGQTRLPDEVIVVDDGSTDDTDDVVARYPGVRLVAHDRRRGVSAARNSGIAAARGDWIAFLDSDDRWLPRKLELQHAALAADPGSRVCHGEELWIRDGRRVNPPRRYAKRGGDIFLQALALCAISPSTALVHRSVFDDIGGFDEQFPVCEDYDLWLRLTCREAVTCVAEPLIEKHGGHADQLSRDAELDAWRIRALEKLLDTTPLGPDRLGATLAMLARKASIWSLGARRRGRAAEAERYERCAAEAERRCSDLRDGPPPGAHR